MEEEIIITSVSSERLDQALSEKNLGVRYQNWCISVDYQPICALILKDSKGEVLMLWNIFRWYDATSGSLKKLLIGIWICLVILPLYLLKLGFDLSGPVSITLVFFGILGFLILASSRFYYEMWSKPETEDFLGRWLLTLIAFLVAGIPTWIVLLVKFLLGAEGFWQKLIVYGVGIWFMGTFQLILLVILFICLIKIWTM